MKTMKITGIALTMMGFAACGGGDEPVVIPEFGKTVTEVQVEYGKSVDLSTLFQATVPTTQLKYVIKEQPTYSEAIGSVEITPATEIKAYSIEGSTLKSAGNELAEVNNTNYKRVRTVVWGELEVSIPDHPAAGVKKAKIITTGIPKPTPVISLRDPETTKITAQTIEGDRHAFTVTSFNIMPVDYNESDLAVAIGEGDYILPPDEDNAAIHAGGVGSPYGTGGWVYAYLKTDDPAAVLNAIKAGNKQYPYAQLFVDVTYVEPNAVVGLLLREGYEDDLKWSDTGAKAKFNFLSYKLADGTIVDAVSKTGITLLLGESSVSKDTPDFINTGSNDDTYPDWKTGNVKLNQSTNGMKFTEADVNTKVSMTFTVKQHFKAEGWTVKAEFILQP